MSNKFKTSRTIKQRCITTAVCMNVLLILAYIKVFFFSYEFPSNIEKTTAWKRRIRREEFKPTKYLYVCAAEDFQHHNEDWMIFRKKASAGRMKCQVFIFEERKMAQGKSMPKRVLLMQPRRVYVKRSRYFMPFRLFY